MPDRTTFDDDGALDELVREQTSLHIERMDDRAYWVQIGEDVFLIIGEIKRKRT